jgi:signal transduction histidine kinase
MTVDTFPRYDAAGTDWLHAATSADRVDLLIPLVSRFNHDLRTPLNTIAGWTHLLQTGVTEATRVRHVSEVFARNVREQTTLLEEFVDDARALLEVLALHPTDVGAGDVVSAASERLGPALELHELRLETDTTPDLRLHADLARTQRLVYRLLLTAVRRAPEGSIVKLSLFEADPCLVFSIEAPAARGKFEDAILLDLRIASAVSVAARGTLEVGRPEDGTRLLLRLPLAAS